LYTHRSNSLTIPSHQTEPIPEVPSSDQTPAGTTITPGTDDKSGAKDTPSGTDKAPGRDEKSGTDDNPPAGNKKSGTDETPGGPAPSDLGPVAGVYNIDVWGFAAGTLAIVPDGAVVWGGLELAEGHYGVEDEEGEEEGEEEDGELLRGVLRLGDTPSSPGDGVSPFKCSFWPVASAGVEEGTGHLVFRGGRPVSGAIKYLGTNHEIRVARRADGEEALLKQHLYSAAHLRYRWDGGGFAC